MYLVEMSRANLSSEEIDYWNSNRINCEPRQVNIDILGDDVATSMACGKVAT